MLKHLTRACLLAALLTRLHGAEPIELTAESLTPPLRYLFVLDTSSSMSRQKEAAIDTIHKLLLSGVGGRVKEGDAIGIWTFSETLQTNGFPTELWSGDNREAYANRAYRWLRDQRLSKKGDISAVIPAINDAAAASESLTVFLLTDGSKPLRGTKFDAAVNPIFRQHAEGMKKAKKPFVLALVAADGKLQAHGLSPAGGRLYVPNVQPSPKADLAKATNAPAAPLEPPGLQPVPTAPPPQTATTATNTPAAPPAKTKSVEEIAAILRQSQKDPSLKETTPATATPSPVPGQAEPSPAAETGAATQEPAPVSSTAEPASSPVPTSTHAPSTASQDRFATSPASQGALAKPEPSPHTTPIAQTGAAAAPSRDLPTTGAPPESEPEPAPTPPAPPQFAVAQPAGLSADAKLYLTLAIVFLLVACVFGYFLFRRPRATVGPSLISRMMAEEGEDRKGRTP